MDNVLITSSPKRAEWARIFVMLAAYLTAATGVAVSPSQVEAKYRVSPAPIVMGQYLDPNASQYDFNPKAGAQTLIPTEIKLQQSDLFFCTGLSLRLSRADYASGAYSNHGNYPKLTHIDPDYFNYTKTSSKDEHLQLNLLRNGTLSATVMSSEIIGNMLTENLLFYPQLPNITANAAGASNNTTVIRPAYPALGPSDGERGYYDPGFNFIIDGDADTNFRIVLPSGAKDNIDGNISTGATAATTRNIVWLMLNGFRISPGNPASNRLC